MVISFDSGQKERLVRQNVCRLPLVVVKKKDGSDRMFVDFRTLNKLVKPVSFPLPLIDDILCLLGRAKYFTALDLKGGYWQFHLD
jgi:putative transposase